MDDLTITWGAFAAPGAATRAALVAFMAPFENLQLAEVIARLKTISIPGITPIALRKYRDENLQVLAAAISRFVKVIDGWKVMVDGEQLTADYDIQHMSESLRLYFKTRSDEDYKVFRAYGLNNGKTPKGREAFAHSDYALLVAAFAVWHMSVDRTFKAYASYKGVIQHTTLLDFAAAATEVMLGLKEEGPEKNFLKTMKSEASNMSNEDTSSNSDDDKKSKKQRVPVLRCTYCKKKNHEERDCRTKQADLEAAKAARKAPKRNAKTEKAAQKGKKKKQKK
eukprot:GILI01002578.1.p1 GENE.GILI01002578.1~~GILI01002578.1.p1  ORF type:complete len:295 (+),score=36.07 GILI01002578.1:43-885(+)